MLDAAMIERGLEKTGKSKGGLARAMGVRPGAVSEILSGLRLIKASEIAPIMEYLELNSVPIMGRVGAGAVIEPENEQVPPEGLGEVELPFPVPEETIAFEVAGDSAGKLLRRGSRGAAEDRRALPEDYRARQIAESRRSHEFQRQADQRRQAGMDRGDLRDAAERPDRADAGQIRRPRAQGGKDARCPHGRKIDLIIHAKRANCGAGISEITGLTDF